VDTFVGAEEVQEIFYLRDQNKALIKLVAELKVENLGDVVSHRMYPPGNPAKLVHPH